MMTDNSVIYMHSSQVEKPGRHSTPKILWFWPPNFIHRSYKHKPTTINLHSIDAIIHDYLCKHVNFHLY